MTFIARQIAEEAGIALTQFRALCITGPRQSGKTTLCKALNLGKPYVNFENPRTQIEAEENPELFMAQFQDGAIFDEVQRVPHIFRYLQMALDENAARGQFILTGSNNFLLQEQVSQSLAGRAGYLTLLPLSFSELQNSNRATTDLYKLLFTGGYPEIWQEKLMPEKWLASYLQTYVQRDVRLLKNISNLAAFTRFIYLCANFAGQLMNRSELAKNTGVDTKTIQSWLGLLENSYVIFQLQPYYKNLNKRIVKSAKIYFYDTGLLCYLLGISEQKGIENHAAYGAIFENWVISEIRKNRYNRGINGGMYFFRDSLGNEVDLIVEKENAPLAIEIKSSKNLNGTDYQGLKYWQKLQPQSNLALIYGGKNSAQEGKINALPWQEVVRVF